MNNFTKAVICITLILIAVIIPAIIWAGVIYLLDLTNWEIVIGTIVIMTVWLIARVWFEIKCSKRRWDCVKNNN